MLDIHKTEIDLNKALCNFCNSAGDAWEPVSRWNAEVKRNLSSLCKAYDAWHSWMKETGRDPFVADKR